MPKKILIIDPDRDMRALISVTVRQLGHNPLEAGNGSDGINRTISEIPDLIVMDLELPDLWGTEVAKRLKEDARTAKIPIIAHTAWGLEHLRDEAYRVGFADYLVRPVTAERLAEAIERLTRGDIGAKTV